MVFSSSLYSLYITLILKQIKAVGSRRAGRKTRLFHSEKIDLGGGGNKKPTTFLLLPSQHKSIYLSAYVRVYTHSLYAERAFTLRGLTMFFTPPNSKPPVADMTLPVAVKIPLGSLPVASNTLVIVSHPGGGL